MWWMRCGWTMIGSIMVTVACSVSSKPWQYMPCQHARSDPSAPKHDNAYACTCRGFRTDSKAARCTSTRSSFASAAGSDLRQASHVQTFVYYLINESLCYYELLGLRGIRMQLHSHSFFFWFSIEAREALACVLAPYRAISPQAGATVPRRTRAVPR